MAFYKRVNLTGPSGEKLQGWVAEKFSTVGATVKLAEDELTRPFVVSEAGDQLLLESQIDPRHLLNPIVDVSEKVKKPKLAPAPAPEANGAVPEAILAKPKRTRAAKASSNDQVQ